MIQQDAVDQRFDVLAFGAHPDDLEVAMGGTTAMLADKGLAVLFVDLTDGEPTRHAGRGARQVQAAEAARVLGVKRLTLEFPDRLIDDSIEARVAVARLIRTHRPRYVFTTKGAGVHPDHRAVTDIVTNGVFYSRLPKWDEVAGAAKTLHGTEPHSRGQSHALDAWWSGTRKAQERDHDAPHFGTHRRARCSWVPDDVLRDGRLRDRHAEFQQLAVNRFGCQLQLVPRRTTFWSGQRPLGAILSVARAGRRAGPCRGTWPSARRRKTPSSTS